MDINDVVIRIKETLNRVAPDAKAILYGSQARGDARVDSDIDFLVLLRDPYEGKEFVRKRFQISDSLYGPVIMKTPYIKIKRYLMSFAFSLRNLLPVSDNC